MSDAAEGVGRTEDGEHTSIGGAEDTGNKPRPEVPIAVNISTPTTVMAENGQQTTSAPADGYFTSNPAASEQKSQVVISKNDGSILGVSFDHSVPANQPASAMLLSTTRPSIQSTQSSLSVRSTDSTVTVTPDTSAPTSAPVLLKGTLNRPDFPNQAYSALQSQTHPASHAPPTLRQRSSHPGQIFTFTSALASLHQTGPRAVNNSAPVTPGGGLYSRPVTSSEYEPAVTPGTYASPFLHFTQRVPPKETHTADVDVDPISGRKLINQYEIMDELGRGTHGKVKLGRDLTSAEGSYVAIKIVERFSKRRKLGKLGTTEDKVKKEVAILKQVRHPNVTALLEVIDDPNRKKVYLILEWVERGQIQWRVKGAREIAMVEARRYERGKSGIYNPQLDAEGAAILAEAQRRLSRQKRRQLRTFRRIRRDVPDEAWSNELIGDDESEISDDDKLSRISTESYSSKLLHVDARRASRTPSPLPPLQSEATAATDYQSVANEPQSYSPSALSNVYTGLEGTMYGAYIPGTLGSAESSRVGSVQSFAARQRSKTSSDSLSHLASEVLDGDLNDELEYVPAMTMQDIRVAFRDTLLGLQYLHYQGIIHRDIKPPNLLATRDQRVKISDFGVSYLGRPKGESEPGEDVSEHEATNQDGAKELAKTVGTPAFYAPELCITEPIDDPPPITSSIDVWALGVTLFCMLFARTPFVDSEFVVMRQIAEEEIYIPRTRLRPVEAKSRSRPSSQRRAYPPLQSERREELELSYEDINNDLYDLLKRMLIKDPKKRMTLEEARHHPWVLADIHDKVKWLEETDPPRQSNNKKIEVSREDVNAAVVPLQFLDRIKYGMKMFGERLGLGTKPAATTSTTRGRTRSSVGGGNDVSPSPSSTLSSIASQDRQKSAIRGDDSPVSSLKAARDGEHPLAKSLNTSPEQKLNDASDQGGGSRPELAQHRSERLTPPRSTRLERETTVTAATASLRTVKQSDFDASQAKESPPPSPGMPETPTSLESPTAPAGGWGIAKRILNTVRERSSARTSEGRASSRSSRRESMASLDTHGEPSVAISQTTAAGVVNSSAALDEYHVPSVTSSAWNSPSASRPLSAVSSPSGDRLYPTETIVLSRTNSSASISPTSQRSVQNIGISRSLAGASDRRPPESSADEWQRAEQEHIRKLIREEEQVQEQPSAFDDRNCPPSPDDHRPSHVQPRRMSSLDISEPQSSLEASPTGQGSQLPAAMASSTSDLGSAVSVSMSNPSIPSVISEASSLDSADAMVPSHKAETTDLMSSDDTVNPRSAQMEHGEEFNSSYTAHPLAHDGDGDDDDDDTDYDSSSDSDGGLVMSRRKSAAKPAPSGKGSEPQSESEDRHTVRLARSGSNNTTKRMPSTELSTDQGEEQTPKSPE